MLQDTPSFLTYWRNARSRTVRVLEALGPEDLEWAPMPGAFSFGDLFRHLAGLERFMYAETVQGRPNRYPGHGADLAVGLDGMRAYLDRCHAESLALFGQRSAAASWRFSSASPKNNSQPHQLRGKAEKPEMNGDKQR